MKVLKSLNVMAMAAMMLAFAGCTGKDSEEVAGAPAARLVQGTYSGPMACAVMGMDLTVPEVSVTLTAVSDDRVKMEIKSFGIAPGIAPGVSSSVNMTLPDLTVPEVKAYGENGNYTLPATTYSGVAANGKNYTVTVRGSQTLSSLALDLNIKYGSMPMPIVGKYQGLKR